VFIRRWKMGVDDYKVWSGLTSSTITVDQAKLMQQMATAYGINQKYMLQQQIPQNVPLTKYPVEEMQVRLQQVSKPITVEDVVNAEAIKIKGLF
jgi:hypothetical protein